MTDFKVNGLVIQEREIGENDKLLTVLSERYGKLFVIGKGVKSLKNRHMHCCHLLSYVSLNLRKKGNYYYITESDLIENFFGIRNDIIKLSLAAFICDVVNHIAQEGQGEDSILRLTLNTLFAILKEKQPFEAIRAAFQIKVLAEAGFYPDLTSCSICKTAEIHSGYLDLIDGVIICNSCKDKLNFTNSSTSFLAKGMDKPVAIISKSAIEAINFIVNSDSKRFLSFTMDPEDLNILCNLSDKFLLNQLERGFNSLDFYKSLLKY